MPRFKFNFFTLALLAGLLFASPAASELKVVTTIKPLHSIVSNIMLGAGEPVLLMRSAISPHDYKLKPSDIRTLHQANVIFWVGPALEHKLTKAIQQSSQAVEVVALMTSEKLTLSKHIGHEAADPHIWLSVKNARAIATIVQRTLSSADTGNAALYLRNLKKFEASLTILRQEISSGLSLVLNSPFIVHHDGLLYFEKEFGLNNQGAVLISSEHRPGAKRIATIRQLIKSQHIACVFGEPQYSQKLLKTITAHSAAKIGVIDLIGVKLTPGPDLYASLMRNLMTSFKSCLMAKP